MEFQQFIEWSFYGIVSCSFIYGISILSHLKKSIDELNLNVTKLVEKSIWHEKELDRLENRLNKLEGGHV